MRNLLSKKEVLLLEKAVDWDKSALGLLTNAILRPISFITGSIKKGFNKKQMNVLVKQWGLEYVKAIEAVDNSKESIINTDDVDKITDHTNGSDTSINISDELKNKVNNKIKTYDIFLKELKQILSNVVNWTNVDTKDTEFKKMKTSIKTDNIDSSYLDTLLENNTIKNTETYKKNIEVINKFLSNVKKSESISDYLNIFQDISKFHPTIKNVIKNIDQLSDINEIVNSTINNTELGQNNQEHQTQQKQEDKKYKTGDKITYQKKDGSKAEAVIDDQTGVNPGFIKIKTKNSSFVIKQDKIVESYNFINEASAYELPNKITDLLPIQDIERLKQEPNIKEEVTKALNFERLNTIMYEANFLINKLKNSKATREADFSVNKAKKFKSSDDIENAEELQRIWDLGVQNTNDYFQDLVDIDKVKSQIKGTVDSNTKKTIEEDQTKLDNYQKMGITEVFPIGEKFNIKKLYAFDIILTGQTNKIKKMTLLMSPTQDFVEDVSGEKYFWFKLFGAYKWDDKENKMIRTNPFSNMSQNPELVSSLMVEGNSVYISTKMLRPSANSSYLFIYDNKGKYFYNTKKYNTIDVATEIMKYKKDDLNKSLKEISNVSNIMKMKIVQRFIIDDENINNGKYPGISSATLNMDKNINNAKTNHDKLINLLAT